MQPVTNLEVTVVMQRESSRKNATASDTNEDRSASVQPVTNLDGLILDPTEAKTPNASWCWLPAEVEAFGEEKHRISYPKVSCVF
jgi:hypothetical protein